LLSKATVSRLSEESGVAGFVGEGDLEQEAEGEEEDMRGEMKIGVSRNGGGQGRVI